MCQVWTAACFAAFNYTKMSVNTFLTLSLIQKVLKKTGTVGLFRGKRLEARQK